MNNRLQENVQEVIGEIHTVEFLDEQGGSSEVRKIITKGASYLLKSCFNERYRAWLKSEAQILEKLNHNKLVPAPAYYGFIEEEEGSHLIMSFEEGISLTAALKEATSLDEKKSLIRSFGKFIHQLHNKESTNPLKQENDWLEGQLVKAQSYVENGQTEGSSKLLVQLMTDKPLPVQQTMIHGDCTTDNVLVFDGEVRMFIDVAFMTVGDPRYDESLAIRKFVNNPEYIHTFYDGYKHYKVSKEELQYFNEGLYEFF